MGLSSSWMNFVRIFRTEHNWLYSTTQNVRKEGAQICLIFSHFLIKASWGGIFTNQTIMQDVRILFHPKEILKECAVRSGSWTHFPTIIGLRQERNDHSQGEEWLEACKQIEDDMIYFKVQWSINRWQCVHLVVQLGLGQNLCSF